MSDPYEPRAYWEARLGRSYDLRGVGHASFGIAYNEWLYRAKRRCLQRALAHTDLRGKRVLDVGSGTGFFADWYAARGAEVHGLDIAGNAVAALNRRFGNRFRVADISAAEFRCEATFDIVNAWDVIYHIVDDARFERALANMGACLSTGGLMLVSDAFAATEARRVAEHVRLRNLACYQPVLEAMGLGLVSVEFLYRWLNREVTRTALDDRLGGAYYWLDGWCRRPSPANLSVAVWRPRG